MTVPIVELAETCVEMRSRSLDLFARLGHWVTATSDPAHQRLFAMACHRHAWHAELWQARTPTIPGAGGVSTDRPEAADADDRLAWYADQLAQLDADLSRLSNRVDPEVDPSTTRTVKLVAADVSELRSLLAV